ncbi:hypothetical protein V22_24920 [Calycomorphotria hydatis]|uniref:Uncharacterized protein n=2 Tax=Calycomorphotria hydatis TaxID=2528027 RepID=A0A517TA53_9PLAN|nr:hypothetical protein V22_24920 [Calycomorphotria hydatis]
MLKKLLQITLVSMVITLPGCKPANTKAVTEKVWKHLLKRHLPEAAKRNSSSLTDDLLKSSKGTSAASHTDDLGEEFGKKIVQAMRMNCPALPNALSNSQQLGKRLSASQHRIPPVVYLKLISEWRQSDAELKSLSRQLKVPDLDEKRRERLEQKLDEAISRQEKIDRLIDEYG